MLITKSKFVAGVQCLKRLYLTVHTPELAAQPDESDQSIIDQGREVGLLARQMFPGGVVVECKDREQAIRMTRELIENPEPHPASREIAARAYGSTSLRISSPRDA